MSKSKKNKSNPPQAPLKPENYIRKIARNQPIYECKIHPDWKEIGITPVLVARQKPNGNLIVGTYVVDTWCLGLKDTGYWHDLTLLEYEKLLDKLAGEEYSWVNCTPTLAFNLIYGAIEYAEDLGFSPHKDFAVSEYILDDIENITYLEVEFGLEGKPHYLSGPYDNVELIIKTLDKNVGAGNYNVTRYIGGETKTYNNIAEAEEDFDVDLNSTRITELGESGALERKLAQLQEESEVSALILQITAAHIILNYYDNDIKSLIEEGYYEDDLEEIMDMVMKEIEAMLKVDGKVFEGEKKTELRVQYTEMTEYLLSKIMETGGVDFLVAEEYRPLPPELSAEEYAQLSEEEQIQYKLKQLEYLPLYQREKILMSGFVRPIVDQWMTEQQQPEIDEDVIEAVLEAVFKGAREEFSQFDDPSDTALKELVEEVTYDILEAYNSRNTADD